MRFCFMVQKSKRLTFELEVVENAVCKFARGQRSEGGTKLDLWRRCFLFWAFSSGAVDGCNENYEWLISLRHLTNANNPITEHKQTSTLHGSECFISSSIVNLFIPQFILTAPSFLFLLSLLFLHSWVPRQKFNFYFLTSIYSPDSSVSSQRFVFRSRSNSVCCDSLE